jgi:cytochrome c-type biogenesis protein CcmH/NrfF
VKSIARVIVLALIGGAFLPSVSVAYNWYYDWVKGAYPLTERTRSCVLCHSRQEGVNLNAYGKAFRAAGASRRALSSIANQDADRDGASNASELRTAHFPGDPADVPTRAELAALRAGRPMPVNAEREILETLPCPCCGKWVLECECSMVPEIRRIVHEGVAHGHKPAVIRERLVARFGPEIVPLADRHTTLSPKHFSDRRISNAYRIAQAMPRVLEKYPCFCDCFRDSGHLSLLDCYKNDHGSHCEICMMEAEMIDGAVRQGQPDARIRETLLSRFGSRR